MGLREALAHQRRFATAPISEVLSMAHHVGSTSFKPLPAGAPLVYAAQALVDGSGAGGGGVDGVHAVPIVSPDGSILRMLTQADVIRFLAAHVDELGPLGTVTVSAGGVMER
jgi:hypothetical protein